MIDPGQNKLAEWTLEQGYVSNISRGRGGNFMALGSQNAMCTGAGYTRAFRGVDPIIAKIGSRVFFFASETYAGLGNAVINGVGSIFIARNLLFFIGAGQVNFNGAEIAGVSASSTLSLIKKVGGFYLLANQYQAGHAQPSAPIIYAKASPSAGKRAISGAVVAGVHRISTITGQVSNVSLVSNSLLLSEQTMLVQIPLVDANGQDLWGVDVPKIGFAELGTLVQLPVTLGGQVSEATISATLPLVNPVIGAASDVVDVSTAVFTSEHVGWRIAFGAFDSYIIAINSDTQVQVTDESAGGEAAAAGVITYAIDGVTRAVEIGYSNADLFGQLPAPTKAYPPTAGSFAGVMMDTFWMEGDDSIIYVGEPGFVGSFPPSNALFAREPATLYLEAEEGVTLRFSPLTIGALYYVGGSPAIEYQLIRFGQGVKYAQNAFIGFGGRVCAWTGGLPSVLNFDASRFSLDHEYARAVLKEFAGWNEEQTADRPIVGGYDAVGEFECWALGKMVLAKLGPTGAWCAPTDLTELIPGDIVGATTTLDGNLYLSVINGADLVLYQYDAGTGSVMIIQTDDKPANGSFNDVTLVAVRGRADNLTQKVKVEVVANFDYDNPDEDAIDATGAVPERVGVQDLEPREPNVTEAKAHSVKVTWPSEGGDCGVDNVCTYGSTSETVLR